MAEETIDFYYETDLKILPDIIYWFNHYDALNNWEHFMINVYKWRLNDFGDAAVFKTLMLSQLILYSLNLVNL